MTWAQEVPQTHRHRLRELRPLLLRAGGVLTAALIVLMFATSTGWADDEPGEGRTPANDADLRDWLTNMVGAHRFSVEEAARATGMSNDDVETALKRFGIGPETEVAPPQDRLLVLPYPGGRHPRIGFLEGAVDPQRETKVSVFTPWHDPAGDRADYVVVDVPEAIWSQLGLTYLAHTHVPTVWTKQGIEMQRLEWQRHDDGSLTHRRELPGGIAFTSAVHPQADHVRMRMTLTNGTDETLTGLRVQMCVMLKGADGFTEQTNDNKVLKAPYAAVHDRSRRRWVLTAWKPNQRTWANQRCPCLHSDPQFADCPPGETQTIDGWLSFYDGTDVESEFARIEQTGWWKAAP